MSLIRNGANVLSGLSRFHSAYGAFALRGGLDRTGAMRCFPYGEAAISGVTDKAGWPNGYRSQTAFMLPQKSGAMSSRNEGYLTITGAAVGAKGLNGVATTTITLSGSAIGGLISGGVANGTISITGSANIFAGIVGQANGTITISGTGSITAKGFMVANTTVSLNGAVQPYAIGWMDATSDFGNELTPANLADAVLSSEIETGMTLQDALKLISAATAGKISGAATTTITIRNAVVDSKNRIIATVDADGNRSAITYDLT
jgi:hypothetical protein